MIDVKKKDSEVCYTFADLKAAQRFIDHQDNAQHYVIVKEEPSHVESRKDGSAGN